MALIDTSALLLTYCIGYSTENTDPLCAYKDGMYRSLVSPTHPPTHVDTLESFHSLPFLGEMDYYILYKYVGGRYLPVASDIGSSRSTQHHPLT